VRDAAIEKYNAEHEAVKVTKRELEHQTKLLKEKGKEEKRVAREATKVVSDQAKAGECAAIDARKAEGASQKQARDAGRSIPLPNQGKLKASRQLQSTTTKKRGDSAGCSQVIVHKPSLAPPPTYNSRGRKIALPKRYM
jgi:hypothetical protein